MLGSRAIDIERRHQNFFLVALAQAQAQFGTGRGFTRALQTNHQDRHRRRADQVEVIAFVAQRCHQLIVDDLDNHLAGRNRTDDILTDGLDAHRFNEILDHRQGHVGFQQGDANLAQGFIDVRFLKRTALFQLVEYTAQTFC